MYKILKIVLGGMVVAMLVGVVQVEAATGINRKINFQGKVVNQ